MNLLEISRCLHMDCLLELLLVDIFRCLGLKHLTASEVLDLEAHSAKLDDIEPVNLVVLQATGNQRKIL